jgi:hypothetical protein
MQRQERAINFMPLIFLLSFDGIKRIFPSFKNSKQRNSAIFTAFPEPHTHKTLDNNKYSTIVLLSLL